MSQLNKFLSLIGNTAANLGVKLWEPIDLGLPDSSSNLKSSLAESSNPKAWWAIPNTPSESIRSSKKLKHQIKRRETSKRAKIARKKNRK